MVPAVLASATCAALLALGERPSDRIETKSGNVHTGHVVYRDRERVVLRDGSRTRAFPLDEVSEVRSAREDMRILLVYLQDAELGRLEILKEIAEYAERRGLEGTARLMWLKALIREPDDLETNQTLGNRRRHRRWYMRHDGGWRPVEELLRETLDWSDAWELDSLHFEMRASVKVDDAVDALFDLEHFYYAFFEFFAPHVELHELLEPLRVHVYTDRSSFPEVGWGARSYFSPDESIAFLNAADGLERGQMLHEGCHLLLHGIVERSKRAEFPAWLEEGLAEYLRAASGGRRGRLILAPGGVLMHHFTRHASEEDPFELGRMLTLTRGEYLTSASPELKYAQSYTLVDFLLHGSGGELREPFFEYFASCLEGRSSPTDFQKVFEVPEDELQEAWTAHVADIAVNGARDRAETR